MVDDEDRWLMVIASSCESRGFVLIVGTRGFSSSENAGEAALERYGGGRFDSEGALGDSISPFLFNGGNPQ